MIRIILFLLIGSLTCFAQVIPCNEILNVVNQGIRNSEYDYYIREDIYNNLDLCKDVELETMLRNGDWSIKKYRAALLGSVKSCNRSPIDCRGSHDARLHEYLYKAAKVPVEVEGSPPYQEPPRINFTNFYLNMGVWPPLGSHYDHVSTSFPIKILPLTQYNSVFYTVGSRLYSFYYNRIPGGISVEKFYRPLNEIDNDVVRIDDPELFPKSEKRWEYFLYPAQGADGNGCYLGGFRYPDWNSLDCLGAAVMKVTAQTLVIFRLPDDYQPTPEPTPSPTLTPSPTPTPNCTSVEETKEKLFNAVNEGQTTCSPQPRSQLYKQLRKIRSESCEPVDFTLKSAAKYIDTRKSSLRLPSGCDLLTQKVIELAGYRLYNSAWNSDRLAQELPGAGFTCHPASKVHPFKYDTILPNPVMLRLSKAEARRRKMNLGSERDPKMESFIITEATDPDAKTEFEKLKIALDQGGGERAINDYNKRLSTIYKDRRNTTKFLTYGASSGAPSFQEISLGEAAGRTLICVPPRAKIDPETGSCSVPFEALEMTRTYNNWKEQREAEKHNLPDSRAISEVTGFNGIEKYDLPSQVAYFETLALEALKEWCGGELPQQVPTPIRLITENGSRAHTVALSRVIGRYFPGIKAMGGYRSSNSSIDKQGHPAGLAIDAMVVKNSSNFGLAVAEFGAFLNRYFRSNYVNYVIWNSFLARMNRDNEIALKGYTGPSPHKDHPHLNLGKLPTSKSSPYRNNKTKKDNKKNNKKRSKN